MKLRKIFKEYPQYYEEYHSLDLNIGHQKIRTESEIIEFQQRWRAGTASIRDWIKSNTEEINAAVTGLSSEQVKSITDRQYQLYDWWLEIEVQNRFMEKIKKVLNYAPHRLKEYCKIELNLLDKFLAGEMKPSEKEDFKREKRLYGENDLSERFARRKSTNYTNHNDLLNESGENKLNALLRFREYLVTIIEEGIDDEISNLDSIDEFAAEHLWPEVYVLSNTLTVEYKTTHHFYDDQNFVDYTINAISGNYLGWSLKKQLLRLFAKGFQVLINKISSLTKAEQMDILTGIRDDLDSLKSIVVDGEYMEKASEYNPEKLHQFKRFERLKYKGDNDLRFAFNHDSRSFIDKKLSGYATAWIEGLEEMDRKIEHLYNNLELLISLPESGKYNLKNIFENVFVLESFDGAIQGTAFHLSGVGLVTCDHCVRHPGNQSILTDLKIFRNVDHSIKMDVSVLLSHEVIDIALLQLKVEGTNFLKSGLTIGQSDCKLPLKLGHC